jgi:hypothetical protein
MNSKSSKSQLRKGRRDKSNKVIEQQNTLISKIQQSIAEIKSNLGSEINSLKLNLDFTDKNMNELIDYTRR